MRTLELTEDEFYYVVKLLMLDHWEQEHPRAGSVVACWSPEDRAVAMTLAAKIKASNIAAAPPVVEPILNTQGWDNGVG